MDKDKLPELDKVMEKAMLECTADGGVMVMLIKDAQTESVMIGRSVNTENIDSDDIVAIATQLQDVVYKMVLVANQKHNKENHDGE